MLENIRKYTGLMVVVLILLFVGLIFLSDTSSSGSLGGGPAIAKMEGRDFTYEDQRHAEACLQLASMMNSVEFNGQLMNLSRYGRLSWVEELVESTTYQNYQTEFMINRALLRKYAAELGIFPNKEAVEAHIKTLPYFSGFTGSAESFDQEKFEKFKSKTLGRYQLRHEDFIELMEDELRFIELRNLVAGDVTLPAEISQLVSDRAQQVIDLDFTTVNRADFEPNLEIPEEDIKAYWEENKEKYLTDEQRKIDYFVIALKDEFKPAPLPTAPKLAEEATEEEKQAAREKHQAEVAEQMALREKLDTLIFLVGETLIDHILEENEGKAFLSTAEQGLEVVKQEIDELDLEDAGLALADIDQLSITTGQSDFFTPGKAPAAIQLPLSNIDPRASRRNTADFVFATQLDGEESERVSNLLTTPQNSALAFKVTDSVAAEPLEYSDARSSARADLKSQRLDEVVEQKAQALIDTLQAAAKEEQDLAAAAKEAGYELKSIAALSAGKPEPELPNAAAVFAAASTVDPGQVGEAVEQSSTLNEAGQSISEGKVVFVVRGRKIPDTADTAAQRDQAKNRLEAISSRIVFREWLRAKQQEAQVTILSEVN